MNRRGFVGVLLASTVGLTLDPKSLLWRPASEALALPAVMPSALLTIEQITAEACRCLTNRLQKQYRVDPIGVMGPGDEQFGVDMEVPGEVSEYGLDSYRYIAPSMAMLADRVRQERPRVFTELSIPNGEGLQVARVTDPSGVSLRGILHEFFDVAYCEQKTLLRFDVLVGQA